TAKLYPRTDPTTGDGRGRRHGRPGVRRPPTVGPAGGRGPPVPGVARGHRERRGHARLSPDRVGEDDRLAADDGPAAPRDRREGVVPRADEAARAATRRVLPRGVAGARRGDRRVHRGGRARRPRGAVGGGDDRDRDPAGGGERPDRQPDLVVAGDTPHLRRVSPRHRGVRVRLHRRALPRRRPTAVGDGDVRLPGW
ncbi:MAG: hypothetical protein J07HB67_01956, partial [halophilic archaeon J07HB67]